MCSAVLTTLDRNSEFVNCRVENRYAKAMQISSGKNAELCGWTHLQMRPFACI